MTQLQTWLADTSVNLVGIQGLGGLGKSAMAAYLYGETSPPAPLLQGEGSKSQKNKSKIPRQTPTPSSTPSPPFPGREGGLGGIGSPYHKFWADVSQKPDFTYFAEKIIEAFGGQISQQGNVTLLINDLLNCLNQRRCLLVIDNLETLLNSERQWLDAAYEQFFSRWVQQGGNSVLLITTQEKPVLFQPQRCWYALAGMKVSEGVALLQQLGIQGTEKELQAFARAVDGHPLTLRLAAGFLREYCGSQLSLAQELGMQFEQVAAEAEGLHRDKRDACLLWILQQHFGRLTEIQADFLFNLSVYRQPFDYQAAAGMLASDGEVAAITIQRLLSELFNRSLLLKTEDITVAQYGKTSPPVPLLQGEGSKSSPPSLAGKGAGGLGFSKNRYKFQYQPLVRQYVQQQATDLSVAHQKAINYYLLNLKQRPWQTIDDVTEYLETFYHWCELKQYAPAFDTIYDDSSYRECCSNFLDFGGYNAIRVQLYSQLVQEWQPSEDERWKLAAASQCLGNAYRSQGEYQKAIEYQQQSLVIFREVGAFSGIANSLGNLGNAYDCLGEYQKAIEYYQQALLIFQKIGDRSGIAYSLMGLGNVYDSLGDYQQAIEYHQQSLVIQREIGDRSGIAKSLGSLGNAYQSLREYQLAIQYYLQSLEIAQEIGDRSGIADSLNNLGIAYLSLGEYRQAIEYYQQSLVIAQEIGDRSGIANSLGSLGNAYQSLREYQLAIDYYQQSLVIFQKIGDRSGIANSLDNLGIPYNSLGEYNKAIDYHQQSLKIKQEIGDRSGIAASLNNLGNAYDSLGEYNKAIEYHQQSLEIDQEIGDRRGEAISWFNLANVLNKLNRKQDAMGAYRNARQLYQSMQLDAKVQDCDNAIQKIEASLAAPPVVVRGFPAGGLGFVWRWLQRLWRLVRGGLRR